MVSRMLETWRVALARRLGQMLLLPDVPVEVGQAFAEAWHLAMAHAESVAQASFDQERNALFNAMADARMLARSADQAREVANTRLAEVQRLVDQQAGQLAELLQQRNELQQRADQLAEAFDAYRRQHDDRTRSQTGACSGCGESSAH